MSDYAVAVWPFLALGMLGGRAFLVWMSIPAARVRYARRVGGGIGTVASGLLRPELKTEGAA